LNDTVGYELNDNVTC